MTTQRDSTKRSLRSGTRSPSLRSGAQTARAARMPHAEAQRAPRPRRRALEPAPPRAYVVDNLVRGVILSTIIGAALWLLFGAA